MGTAKKVEENSERLDDLNDTLTKVQDDLQRSLSTNYELGTTVAGVAANVSFVFDELHTVKQNVLIEICTNTHLITKANT